MNNKKMIKNGFTLLEFMLTIMVILIVTVMAVPLILYAVKTFRINAFKNSAYNILDAVKYYVASTNFDSFPDEGIEISELDLELNNNKFDSGIIKKIGDGNFEIINLKKNNYCAKGTINNMKATDSGCGSLDETAPINAYIYLKNATSNSITVLAHGIDKESEIKYYEYSIDGSKYTKLLDTNEYTFTDLQSGSHKVKVKVTNEAGLSFVSDEKTFETRDIANIECVEKDGLELYQIEKNFICTYPRSNEYVYEYSNDNKNWNKIDLESNTYTFNFKEKGTIYTRVLKNDEVVLVNTINVTNIDKTLNGAYPELLDNMIPVIYDNDRNIWVKADMRTMYFDYENKQWANAVIVKRNKDTDDSRSRNREYYLSEEAIGNEIYEGDIIGYYVWIPRYRYALFNVNSKIKEVETIDIVFENKDVPKSTNETIGSYLTHPAFSYDSEINGFWVSKFQNSASKTSSCYNDINECNSQDIILYSIPDSNRITNISISNAHVNASNMTNKNNVYGLSNDIKSHVITNLEWGSIAYLANSKYGINDNMKTYGTNYKDGLNNSSTGNITGVFDMVGKLKEMVMANYNKDAGKDAKDNSGFKNYGTIDFPIIIDYYNGITSKNRILGDATGETENWYDGYANFINGEYPFFIRGGVMEDKISIYNYSSFSGSQNPNITFRTVLSK